MQEELRIEFLGSIAWYTYEVGGRIIFDHYVTAAAYRLWFRVLLFACLWCIKRQTRWADYSFFGVAAVVKYFRGGYPSVSHLCVIILVQNIGATLVQFVLESDHHLMK